MTGTASAPQPTGSQPQGIVVPAYGGPEAMQLTSLPVGQPEPGQALVRVEAAGLNFIDIYKRSGLYKGALPLALGEEGAGTIEALGPAADGAGRAGLVVGDRVAWASVVGSYATHVLAPVERLVKVPARVSANDAAVMLQGMTAHYLATSTYPLQPGHTCLVHAAAGGVGLLLCQIAKLRGARVFGTVSTAEKAALAERAGADEVIRYTEQDFETETRRLTGGRGVDVVYDSVGRTTFDKSLSCLRPRGMMVLFGQSSGPVPPVDPQVLNQKGSLFLTRPTLGNYTATREELLQRAGELFEWMAAGKLSVRVDRTYPLAEAGAAHRALAGRETKGKVLLIP